MQPIQLVLFDIDGTLLRTGGAGREALDEAFAALHGWADATTGVHVAGSTDERIVRDVGVRFGHAWTDADTPTLKAAYLTGLRRRLREPGRAEACPGVHAAIAALRSRPYVEVALLTGNWQEGAAVKLAPIGLGETFAWGAFAEDAVERDELVPIARARARERGLSVAEVFVIGDTPADVRCARAGQARAIAVDTGFATAESVAETRPDLQLRDLAQGLGWLLALVDQGWRAAR